MAETSQKLFDWSSLITPAMNLGMRAIGDKIAPSADLQSVQNSNANSQAQLAESQRQFNAQHGMAQQKMAQSNQIRQSMMPGMYTTLGFSPEQGRQMAQQYAARAAAPSPVLGGGYGGGQQLGTYAPSNSMQPGRPGLGAQIGKGALGIGMGLAPGLIQGALAGVGPGSATGMAGALGGLGATGAATLGIGAAVGGAALLAKKLIGQGRKQADKLTGPGGMQHNFNEGLREIVAAQQAGQINQQERDQLVRQMYAQLQQDGAQFAQGGKNQAKVVDQMLRHYLENPVTASSLRG